MSLARFKPLYVSLYKSNVSWNNILDRAEFTYTDVDTTKVAQINEVYNNPVVERASNYLCAIERLEISLNGIPFYNCADEPEIIYIRTRADETIFTQIALTENAYSLAHLFQILAEQIWLDPTDDNGLAEFYPTFAIDSSGFIVMTLSENYTFDDFYIEFPRKLSAILGITKDCQIMSDPLNDIDPFTSCKSPYPRADLGDELDHIIIRTNLPTYTDTIGNVKNNVLTDISVPSQYGASMSYNTEGVMTSNGFTNTLRQKLIYIPNERRYLDLNGDFPINNIFIEAMYVDTAHRIHQIPLPFGGIFEVKLGFYLKA